MPRSIYPRTAEHRAKISAALKGRKRQPLSLEHRAKISAGIRCRHREDPGYRTKLSAALKGRPSPLKGRPSPLKGRTPWNKGRPSPLKGRTWEDISGPERAAQRRARSMHKHPNYPFSSHELRRYWKQWRAQRNLPSWLTAQHKTNGLTYFNVQVLYPWSRRWPRRGAVVLTAVYGPPEEKDHVTCHVNGNTRDDHPENLMWMSPFDQRRWAHFKDPARVQAIEAKWRQRLEARRRRPVTLNSLLTSPYPYVENVTSHAAATPSL